MKHINYIIPILISILLSNKLHSQCNSLAPWRAAYNVWSGGGGGGGPLTPAQAMSNGSLKVPANLLKTNDPNHLLYATSFQFRDTVCITDNFTFETRIRNVQALGGVSAYDTRIEIIGSGMNAGASLIDIMDISWAQPYTSAWVGGTSITNQLGLMVNLQSWSVIKMEFRNGTLYYFKDNVEFFQLPYAGNICNIYGFNYSFKGSGEIDWIRLTDSYNNIVYFEDFNDCNNFATFPPCDTPVLTTSFTPPSCTNNALSLQVNSNSTQPLQYNWIGPNGFSSSLPNPTINTPTLANEGTYIVTGSSNYCNPPVKDTIVVNFPASYQNKSQIFSACQGASVTLPGGTVVNTSGTFIDTIVNNPNIKCYDIISSQVTIQAPQVNAGPDQLICYGNTAQLNATGNNILSYSWDAHSTLSALNIPNPIASPTQTTTYIVRSKVKVGTNLVVNGDFEQGNTGFSSAYNFYPPNTAGFTQGQYSVTSTPTASNSGFSNCGDHTTGSSNMLLVDGACGNNGIPSNAMLWCQTIPIAPNTDYAFSAWMTNVFSGPASSTLLFTINGVPIGNPPSTNTTTCVWGEFYVVWNSGNATSANICIAEGTGVCSGNDFAVDDISFYQICDAIDSITVKVDRVQASFTDSTQVNCFGRNTGSATITPFNGIAPFSYAWSNGQNTSVATNLTAGTYIVTITDSAGCTQNNSITITQPPLLTNTITQTQANLCNGNASAAIANNTSGGTGAYSYLWNNGSTTSTINNLAAGFYKVEIRDANNCVIYDSIQIAQPTTLNHSLAISSPILCHGNTTNINTSVSGGTAPYSFLWNNGSITQNLTNINSGVYYIEIKDNNNCSALDTINITEPSLLTNTINQTSPILCNGDLTGINLNATGGTAPYVYTWNNGATSQNLNNITAGTYTIQINDNNNCTLFDTLIINQPPLLTHTLSAALNPLICFGDLTNINVGVNGGTAPYTFNWNTGATSASLTSIPAGFYRVEIQDANNCLNIDSVTITQPNLITSNYNAIFCNTSSYNLPSGRTITNSGVYIDTIATINGCDSIITLDIQLSNIVASINGVNNISCYGLNDGSATAQVNGGILPYSFQWSDNQTTTTAHNLSAGNYSVIIQDDVNCRDTLTIQITEPTELKVNTSPAQSFCQGNSTHISASANGGVEPYSISWSNNNTSWSQQVQPSSTTVYNATVTDKNGCSKSSNVTITVFPNPVANFNLDPEDIVVFGSPISIIDNSSGADNRLWNLGDGTTTLDKDLFTHMYENEGVYCIELETYSIHGCYDSRIKCIEVKPELVVYIPNSFTPNDDKLNQHFRIVSRGFKTITMSIFNRWGEEMIRLEGDQPVIIGWDGTYNGHPAQEGTYMYKIELWDLKNERHLYYGPINLIR